MSWGSVPASSYNSGLLGYFSAWRRGDLPVHLVQPDPMGQGRASQPSSPGSSHLSWPPDSRKILACKKDQVHKKRVEKNQACKLFLASVKSPHMCPPPRWAKPLAVTWTRRTSLGSGPPRPHPGRGGRATAECHGAALSRNELTKLSHCWYHAKKINRMLASFLFWAVGLDYVSSFSTARV